MNSSHLHTDENGVQVEAGGARDDCDFCRAKKGLPPKKDVEAGIQKRLAASGVDRRQPVEQIFEQLEESERLNDELRDRIKNLELELAQKDQEIEKLNKKLARAKGDER